MLTDPDIFVDFNGLQPDDTIVGSARRAVRALLPGDLVVVGDCEGLTVAGKVLRVDGVLIELWVDRETFVHEDG